MKYVGRGVFLRDIVHVSDVRTCIIASRLYLQSKGWLKYHYTKRILSALTGKRAWFYQLPLVNKLMKAAGFNESKNTDASDALEQLDKVTTWIAVRLGKTREEAAERLTIEEIPKHVAEIMKVDCEKSLALVKAHHLPEKFSEEILEKMKELVEEVVEQRKQLSDVQVQIDRFGRRMDTLTAGVLQPC